MNNPFVKTMLFLEEIQVFVIYTLLCLHVVNESFLYLMCINCCRSQS